MRSKANITLVVLVAATLALATFLGVRGVTRESHPGAAEAAARKRAFEKAMKKGNLSLWEAAYWREAAGTANGAAVETPASLAVETPASPGGREAR